jgi:hypothetical protein
MRVGIVLALVATGTLGACSTERSWSGAESPSGEPMSSTVFSDTAPWADGHGPDVFLHPGGSGGTRPNRR